jgi:hypothetical protein
MVVDKTGHLHAYKTTQSIRLVALLRPYLEIAFGLRQYHAESTGSRPITEVKPRRAWIVLGWATALEPQVL